MYIGVKYCLIHKSLRVLGLEHCKKKCLEACSDIQAIYAGSPLAFWSLVQHITEQSLTPLLRHLHNLLHRKDI